MLVCVCLCSVVRVQLCFVSLAGPGLFRAQSRSGRTADPWNTIRLHNKKFHAESRLQKLMWEMIRVDRRKPRKLRAKGAETRHLVLSAPSLTVRGLFEQLFGLYVTMSVGPFDSAACARCSRQFFKASSPEASDDNLWKLKPKIHVTQDMCEVQSELLGDQRDRDESFMVVVSFMAHSRGGWATASTIALRVLDTHRSLALMIGGEGPKK